MKHPTVRAVLQSHKKNKENKSPIAICITVRGKRTYQVTGFHASATEWDKGKCLLKTTTKNSILINGKIAQLINDLEADFLRQSIQGKSVTLSTVRRGVRGQGSHTFNSFALEYIEYLGGKHQPGTIFNYQNEIDKLHEFDPDVSFEDIDNAYLKKYESWLRVKKLSENSIHKNWKILKAVFNAAIKDGITKNYPFLAYDNPKYESPKTIYLTESECDKIEEKLRLPMSDYMKRTGYYFLLGCYSALRFSDWKRFNQSMISDGRLILYAIKNGELVSMKIHARLQRILDVIKDMPPDFDNQKCNEYLKGIAKLAGIEKKISTHSGRHTFGYLCAKFGLSKGETAQLMGISERTVNVYYKLAGVDLNKAIDKWDNPIAVSPAPPGSAE